MVLRCGLSGYSVNQEPNWENNRDTRGPTCPTTVPTTGSTNGKNEGNRQGNKERRRETKRNKEFDRSISHFPFTVKIWAETDIRADMHGFVKQNNGRTGLFERTGLFALLTVRWAFNFVGCGLPVEMFPVGYFHWSDRTAVTDEACLRQSGEPANVPTRITNFQLLPIMERMEKGKKN